MARVILCIEMIIAKRKAKIKKAIQFYKMYKLLCIELDMVSVTNFTTLNSKL